MQPLNEAGIQAADLYWLAFLLTGDAGASIDAAVDAAELRSGANPFFSTWVFRWSRKIAIAKALDAVRDGLRASARRTETGLAERPSSPKRAPALAPEVGKAQLERALLAIDLFPRSVLVLSIFEGLPLEDVATLLGETRDLVEKARVSALGELMSHLSSTSLDRTAAVTASGFGQWQHA